MSSPELVAEILRGLFRSREVKTLMGLTGRVSWVLGLIATITIYTAPPELNPSRVAILVFCGAAWVVLHCLAYGLGMKWPDRFHYGADQLIEIKRMERGDSLSGTLAPAQQKEAQ